MTIIKRILMCSVLCIMVFFTACDLTTPYVFEVHFANAHPTENGHLPIAGLYLKNQDGSWTDSLIPDDQTLLPGQYLVFALEIPKGAYLQYKIKIEHGPDPTITYLDKDSGEIDLQVSSSPVSVRAISIIVQDSGSGPEVTAQGGFAGDPLWEEATWTNPDDEDDIRNYVKVSWSPL